MIDMLRLEAVDIVNAKVKEINKLVEECKRLAIAHRLTFEIEPKSARFFPYDAKEDEVLIDATYTSVLAR